MGHMENYRIAWAEHRKYCQEEVQALTERMSHSSLEHDDHWKAIEEDRAEKLKEIEGKFAEDMAHCESQLRELDDYRVSELASITAHLDTNSACYYRQEAELETELAEQLAERHKVLDEAVEAERQLCETRRDQQQRQVDLLRAEVVHFKGQLGEVRRCYTGSYRRGTLESTPDDASMCSPRSTLRYQPTFSPGSTFGPHCGSAAVSPHSGMFPSPVPTTPSEPQGKRFSRERYGRSMAASR